MNYTQLIEAFGIFLKYDDTYVHALEHDIMYGGPDPELVSAKDLARLEELGWIAADTGNFSHFL